MSGHDLVQAWKDPDRSEDIEHPSGNITLASDPVGGDAASTENLETVGCPPCQGFTVPVNYCQVVTVSILVTVLACTILI